MLRIAVPNKGSLSEPASQMLVEAGYRQRADTRELVLYDADNDTEFFFLRPRDIAIYVGAGQLEVGITGEDLLLDSGAAAEPILQLGFAASTFRFAAQPGTASVAADLAGMARGLALPERSPVIILIGAALGQSEAWASSSAEAAPSAYAIT